MRLRASPENGSSRDRFEMELDPGQGFESGFDLLVELQDGAKVFRRDGMLYASGVGTNFSFTPDDVGEYVVILRNGTRLPLSRGYRDRLQEQIGKGF